ncbi:hypothetical protein DPMN_005420 [Dreissena polymorpha]|uniref:Uncharacterized protein n=1 Tax=Dreissena polymorpha TaxID=45954 RepID=A0A9D4MT82_DREPO|nr:hypothetical protein DPMN_005420 [Dreissena polymorpha]
MTSRVFPWFFKSQIQATTMHHGDHVFQWTKTISKRCQNVIGIHFLTRFQEDLFQLGRDINGTSILSKFHDDWALTLASKVVKRQMYMTHAKLWTKGDDKNSP